jgi:tyrosinase
LCLALAVADKTIRGDLSPRERKEYTDAVLCLQSKPAITSTIAPGAKSRFDDYIVVHIQQTPRNHRSVSFPYCASQRMTDG